MMTGRFANICSCRPSLPDSVPLSADAVSQVRKQLGKHSTHVFTPRNAAKPTACGSHRRPLGQSHHAPAAVAIQIGRLQQRARVAPARGESTMLLRQ